MAASLTTAPTRPNGGADAGPTGSSGAQGLTLEDVKRYLGHSSIVQTSNTYGHLVAGRSAEVAAGMDRALIG
jgi:integrase